MNIAEILNKTLTHCKNRDDNMTDTLSAEQVIERLGLIPHPEEGGFFVETYRDAECITQRSLPDRYGPPARDCGADGGRNVSTAIYYLLRDGTLSAMHRLKSVEVFHFYLGDPVEQLHLYSDGTGQIVTLGSDLSAGHRPQVMVPAGVWQGAILAPGGRWALLGCTVAPGFDFADYDHGDAEALSREWPDFRAEILARTA